MALPLPGLTYRDQRAAAPADTTAIPGVGGVGGIAV
jgi:hypothetical protein